MQMDILSRAFCLPRIPQICADSFERAVVGVCSNNLSSTSMSTLKRRDEAEAQEQTPCIGTFDRDAGANSSRRIGMTHRDDASGRHIGIGNFG